MAAYNKVDIMKLEVNSSTKRFGNSTNHCLPDVTGSQFCVMLFHSKRLDRVEMKRVISRRGSA